MADEQPTTPPAAKPLYSVTRVDDSTMIAPSGGFQRAKRVYYTLSNGTSSFVEVPLASFNRPSVERLIAQDVDTLLDVHTIQGPTIETPPGY